LRMDGETSFISSESQLNEDAVLHDTLGQCSHVNRTFYSTQ